MRNRFILCVIVGLIAGIISGLFSSGGGLVFILAFSLVFKMDEKKSRASTIFCMLPIVITSSFVYMSNLEINYEVAIKCMIGRNNWGNNRELLIKKSK